MPRYKGVLTLEDSGPDTPIVHVFEYHSSEINPSSKQSSYRKKVIALEDCIYLGRRSLATIKKYAQTRRNSAKNPMGGSPRNESQKVTNDKAEQKNENQKLTNEKADENERSEATNDKAEQENENQKIANEKADENERSEATNEKAESKNQTTNDKPGNAKTNKDEAGEIKRDENGKEIVDATKENSSMEEKQVEEEVKKVYLKEGEAFQGYILKCDNGPYDYATKLWNRGRAAPPDLRYPKEGEEQAAVVVNRNGDFLTLACGPNVAFATKKSFMCNGVDPDDLSLPFARLKVSLRRLQDAERVPQVPAAGWEALPTQIVVPPFDIN